MIKKLRIKFLGKVSSGDIIKYSSNIGAARVSTMLSKKQLINNLEKFGFDIHYIDLPGSRNGKLPTTNEISESEHHSRYGYGISVSLMHLVNAYLILANYNIILN